LEKRYFLQPPIQDHDGKNGNRHWNQRRGRGSIARWGTNQKMTPGLQPK
jgi:hypothetical protein